MQIPETRYVRSKEGNVGYQVVGDGPFDLVFIPWWVSNIDAMWEEPSLARFLQRLATFSRVLCFDKRGTGVSDTVPLAALPTLEQWSDDVRTVMQRLGSERAKVLGEPTRAVKWPCSSPPHTPSKTSALVLPPSVRDVDYPWGLPAERVSRELERVGGGCGEPAAISIFSRRASRRTNASGAGMGVTSGSRVRPAGFGRAMFALGDGGSDLRRSSATAIRVPTLVLHRSEDRHIRVGHGRYLAEHIAGAKFVEFPGEDHLFPWVRVKPCLARLRNS